MDPASSLRALIANSFEVGAEHPGPAAWDDAAYALKGTGRALLTPAGQDRLGAFAARLPLLG